MTVFLEQRFGGLLRVTEVRESVGTHAGGGIEFGYGLSKNWMVTLGGRLGGSRFQFQGREIAGRIDEIRWGVRAGVDRQWPVTEGTAVFAGVGAEYEEARGWLENTSFDQEGPHNYFGGGGVRAGAVTGRGRRLGLEAQMSLSIYRGYAKELERRTEYTFLAQSIGFGVGVRYWISPGRPR